MLCGVTADNTTDCRAEAAETDARQAADAPVPRLKVYLETSFISYLTGGPTADMIIAKNQAWTRQWWEIERPKCDVFISDYTVSEAIAGAEEMVNRRLAVMRDVPRLQNRDAEEAALARLLLARHAIPEKEETDAYHIAAASVAGMDFLLTWNCRHMANPRTIPLTRRIVAEAGYTCPAVMTPRFFIESTQMEERHA